MFDPLDCNWKRKGWLHTRWRLAGQPFDLLNVSLPDDVDQRFFVRSMHDFQAHLLERALASGAGTGGDSNETQNGTANVAESTVPAVSGKYYACSGEVWG